MPAGRPKRSPPRPPAAAPARAPQARRGRPPKTEADERRERFLEHALQTFSRLGYRATTMDDLAAGFGASKATVYRTYGSKAGLLLATMQRGVPRVLLPMQAVDTDPERPVADVLRDFARVLVDVHNDPANRALWQAVSEAREELGADPGEIFRQENTTLSPIADYLAQQEAAGRIQVGNPRWAASLFGAQINGGLTEFLAGSLLDPDDERITFALQLFLRSIQPAPGPRRRR